jgi:hypothetical protein
VESEFPLLCSPVTVGSYLNPVHIFATYLFSTMLHVHFHIFQVGIFPSGLSTTENVSRGYNLDIIWEVLFVIPAGAPALLAEIFRGCTQSLQANTRTVLGLGHYCFVQIFSNSSTILHSRYTRSNWKVRANFGHEFHIPKHERNVHINT